MEELPGGLTEYARTAIFDETTVPDKLTNRHDTKAGVWGRIDVLEGALDYHILLEPVEHHVLTAEQPGVVAPTVPHYVTPIGSVRFRVCFLK